MSGLPYGKGKKKGNAGPGPKGGCRGVLKKEKVSAQSSKKINGTRKENEARLGTRWDKTGTDKVKNWFTSKVREDGDILGTMRSPTSPKTCVTITILGTDQ